MTKFSDINLLEELGKPEMAGMRDVFASRNFAKGSIIYHPEEAANTVFIVRTGQVRLFLSYGHKEFTLAFLAPGDIFATHAGTYVQAMDDVELLVTDLGSVTKGLIETPGFTKTMVRVLGRMLKNAFSIIEGLAFKDVPVRLADFLAEMGTSSGIEKKGGVLVRLDLTIEQLANHLGATRQTVSSVLGDMVRNGLLEKQGRGQYFIPDLEALKELSLM